MHDFGEPCYYPVISGYRQAMNRLRIAIRPAAAPVIVFVFADLGERLLGGVVVGDSRKTHAPGDAPWQSLSVATA